MSQGGSEVGLPTRTPKSLDYDPCLLNVALTETMTRGAVSSQRKFTGTPDCDIEPTEGSEICALPASSNTVRDADDMTPRDPAMSDVTQQCLSPGNPFARDVKDIERSEGGESGNPLIRDPSNPFFDALHWRETNGEAMDVDVDGTMETDSPDTQCNQSSPQAPTSAPHLPPSSPHRVKWLLWRGHSIPIATQNENGPCPLLAICNTLLLARKLTLPPGTDRISSESLAQLVANHLLELIPTNLTQAQRLDYDHNVQDAIAMFPKLQTGLDVNVKFSGVQDFEFTQELIVFDLLNVHLYHGWMADPQDSEQFRVVRNLSYNQLVEKIINSQSPPAVSQSPDAATMATVDGYVAENFLRTTASQLTYHGLSELSSNVQENELCVFFRNNHFSSMYKYKNHLYLLVTDQGYLNEPSIVWEHLSNVEGDTNFFDEEFHSAGRHTETQLYPHQQTAAGETVQSHEHERAASVEQQQMSQEDQDYLMAVTLQQTEDEAEASQQLEATNDDHSADGTEQYQPEIVELPSPPSEDAPVMTDRELALQLQQEEMHELHRQRTAYHRASVGRPGAPAARPAAERQVRRPVPAQERRSDCTIL